MVLSLLLSYLY